MLTSERMTQTPCADKECVPTANDDVGYKHQIEKKQWNYECTRQLAKDLATRFEYKSSTLSPQLSSFR